MKTNRDKWCRLLVTIMLSRFILLFLFSRLVFCLFTLNNCGVCVRTHRYCNLENVHRAHIVHLGAISSHSYRCIDHTRTNVMYVYVRVRFVASFQVHGASIFLSFVFFYFYAIFRANEDCALWQRTKPVCIADVRAHRTH